MHKLIKSLVVTGLALATFSVTSITASAHYRLSNLTELKAHQTVPKSFRGEWYSKANLRKNNELKFTKDTYSLWATDGKTIVKNEGSSKITLHGPIHRKLNKHTSLDPLWIQHNKNSVWYGFFFGYYSEMPAMRYTHAYLRDHNGKKHRFPAIESSYYYYGKQGGVPKNVYYFKASSWRSLNKPTTK